MKNILSLFLFLSIGLSTSAQLLKYSTVYISGRIGSPIVEEAQYMMDRSTGQLTDITEVNPFDYNFSIGIRKLARYHYEIKPQFYDGSESDVSGLAPIGNVEGLEYNAVYSLLRNRGEEFTNHNYWVRYLHKNFLVRAEYNDQQDIQLTHFGGEIRGRVSWGKFCFTAGAKHRTHPVYGVNPFEENFDLTQDPWWIVAYDLGYVDEYYYVDGEGNGVDDWYDYFNWNWFDPQGNQIAETDEEFMKYHFGRAVAEYNKQELRRLGLQQELSFVAGVSLYHYTDDFWLHSWADVMPYHYGLSEYSYINLGLGEEVDFDTGFILGSKITRKLGLYIESTYQRYWGIKNYEVKAGINYLFL